MADRGSASPVAILLGAGASAGAGIPVAREITDLFTSFGRTFPDRAAPQTENLVRRVQLMLAEHRGVAASDIDFEPVLGTLMEVATGRLPESVAVFGRGLPALGTNEPDFVASAVTRLFRLFRELLTTHAYRTRYLRTLLALRTAGTTLDIFTLNYDRSVEDMLAIARVRHADGFRRIKGAPLCVWGPCFI